LVGEGGTVAGATFKLLNLHRATESNRVYDVSSLPIDEAPSYTLALGVFA
jgi:hypothetical protein